MAEAGSPRAEMLMRIRHALRDARHQTLPLPEVKESLVFEQHDEELVDHFTRTFNGIDGQTIHCENAAHLLTELAALLDSLPGKNIAIHSRLLDQYRRETETDRIRPTVVDIDWTEVAIGITDCEFLVASTGSIVMSTAQKPGRVFPVYVPVHVVIAQESQLVPNLGEAIRKMEERYLGNHPSAWYLMSGPSRTGDIEKTLVLGVHGPVDVYVFIVK